MTQRLQVALMNKKRRSIILLPHHRVKCYRYFAYDACDVAMNSPFPPPIPRYSRIYVLTENLAQVLVFRTKKAGFLR